MDTAALPQSSVKPWVPHEGPQSEFLSIDATEAYEVLFGGAKGPGKTDCLLMEATAQVEHPRYHGLLLRRTFKQLQEIMDRAHHWYPSLGGTWNGAASRWTFPSGALISMGHVQHESDKYNYQGHEYHYLGFDQLEQFTESIYLYLLAQQRRSVPDLKVYVRATANPGGIGHGWVKRRFIALGPRAFHYDAESETTRVFIPSTVRDNPSIMENDPGYVKRLMLLDPVLQRAFILGDWDVFAGQFFTMWDLKVHIVTPFALPPHWTRFVSLDYGYRAPSSVGWWANDEAGGLLRYQEIYREGLTYKDLAMLILEKNIYHGAWQPLLYLVADPAIWSDISHHTGDLRGQTGYEIMQKIFDEDAAVTGRPIIRIIKADNDRVNGWIRMRERLMPYTDASGRLSAHMRAFSTCEAFTRTIPEQIHADESGNPEDLDTTGEDHAADDSRYAAMSRPVASDAPPKLPTPTDSFWGAVRSDLKRSYQADIQAEQELDEEVEVIA